MHRDCKAVKVVTAITEITELAQIQGGAAFAVVGSLYKGIHDFSDE